MSIPLEDGYTDVIAKAQRGLGLADSQRAERSGLTLDDLTKLKNGEVNAQSLAAIAPVLQLSSSALLQLGEGKYRPDVSLIEGLQSFNTPFEDYTVNSYLVWDTATREAIVFDSGSDATELLHFIVVNGLKVRSILLTHTHGDHVLDLDRVMEKTGAPSYTPQREPLPEAKVLQENATFDCGALRVGNFLTNGHSPGGTTFYITGLEKPVAIVGDSLFAGSMGGAATAWEMALTNNREKILTLPSETILCPGHGPLTTVALENAHNPFYAPR